MTLGSWLLIFSAGNTGRGNMLLCTFQHQRLQSICVLWSNEWTPEAIDVLPAFGTVTSLCWCQSCHLIATSCCRREDKWPAALVTGCSIPRACCLPTCPLQRARESHLKSTLQTGPRCVGSCLLAALGGCLKVISIEFCYYRYVGQSCTFWTYLYICQYSVELCFHMYVFFFWGGGGGER